MSISDAKLEANRLNAALSTGPTSRVGRAQSAQNAIKHGLCGKFTVLESENQDDYNNLLKRFIEAEKPADDVEYELVAKMARETWMSERAVRLFLHKPQTEELRAEDKQEMQVLLAQLDKYMRYQTMHDRAYDRAANALAKHRKERLAQERGFVSQKREEAAEARREKHEKQRDEIFVIRKSREKIKLDLDQIKLLEKFPPEMRAQMLPAAA